MSTLTADLVIAAPSKSDSSPRALTQADAPAVVLSWGGWWNEDAFAGPMKLRKNPDARS